MLEDDSWVALSSLATPRRVHSCAVLEDSVYVMGGLGEASTEILSLAGAGNTWTGGPALPAHVEPDVGQAVVYHGSVYFIDKLGHVIQLSQDKTGWTELTDVGQAVGRAGYPALVVTKQGLRC